MGEPTLTTVLQVLHDIKHTLDVLVVALATEDEDDSEAETLEGASAGRDRDLNQSLG